MAGDQDEKNITITKSQVGAVGDNVTISGGLHFHSHGTRRDEENQPPKAETHPPAAPEPSRHPDDPSRSGDNRPRVFISYARKDKDQARRLFKDLQDAGASPWMDEEDLRPGQDWKTGIGRIINESDFFISLISAHSVTKRGYVQKELKLAKEVQDQLPADDIFIIPARLEDCEIKDETLKKLHLADLFPDWETGVRKILAVILPSAGPTDLEPAIDAYRQKAVASHEKLRLMGFHTRLRVPIRIQDIYIPLRVMIDHRVTGKACFADADDAEKTLREYGCEEISVPEAFGAAERIGRRGIVILGDPGSGKTTHLKRVLLWCLAGGPETIGLPGALVPVFLPLRNLRELDSGLDAFIQDQLADPHLDTPKGFGRNLLKRGNLLFLFDGLDEVADPAQRIRVSRWIDKALQIHTTCRFMVTCRFAGYTPKARLSEDFLEMHMRPLTTDQAGAFIRTWYKIVESDFSRDPDQARRIAEERAANLIDRLAQPDFRSMRVFTMTRNPLLLTNLCLVHRDRGHLPTHRARLYEECIDVLLELWREAIGFKSKVDARTGRRVLQPAALWLHQEEERTRASAEDLRPVIEPALEKAGWPHGTAADFLRVVRDESGLLTGWGQDQYGFMHLGFQEFLAAREIYKQAYQNPDVLDQLARCFGQGWWQEVILLLLARDNPCLFETFMARVIQSKEFAACPELMDMCLEEAAETSVKPFLDLVRTGPGREKDLWERQLGVLRIIERLDENARDRLADVLSNHPDDRIRQWAGTRHQAWVQEGMISEPSGYPLILISGGRFMMGSPAAEEGRYKDESPLHEVTVPDFYMGPYPVTNEQYRRFLEQNPKMEAPKFWADRNFNQPKQPVVGVSWHDAQKFAQWAGLQLPTEAQWEYACRAGTTTRYYTGDEEADLDRAGWYKGNSGGKLHPVGEKEPNAFMLFDMHGNVLEWCEDHWHSSYEDAPPDGRAWVDSTGDYRVLRGGSWVNFGGYCRSADRSRIGPSARNAYFGFRLSRGQTSQDGAEAIGSAARRPEGRRP